MDTITQELDATLQAGLYYAAVTISLTLPDICASLSAPPESRSAKSKARYKRWYDEHLADDLAPLTSEDAYSLRNGVIHQGRFGHKKSSYARIVFNIPDGMDNVIHRSVHNDVLILNAVDFCVTIRWKSWLWFNDNKHDPIVSSNIDRLVRRRPLGLEPYISGLPVIA